MRVCRDGESKPRSHLIWERTRAPGEAVSSEMYVRKYRAVGGLFELIQIVRLYRIYKVRI
jgi:hypothetical protein